MRLQQPQLPPRPNLAVVVLTRRSRKFDKKKEKLKWRKYESESEWKWTCCWASIGFISSTVCCASGSVVGGSGVGFSHLTVSSIVTVSTNSTIAAVSKCSGTIGSVTTATEGWGVDGSSSFWEKGPPVLPHFSPILGNPKESYSMRDGVTFWLHRLIAVAVSLLLLVVALRLLLMSHLTLNIQLLHRLLLHLLVLRLLLLQNKTELLANQDMLFLPRQTIANCCCCWCCGCRCICICWAFIGLACCCWIPVLGCPMFCCCWWICAAWCYGADAMLLVKINNWFLWTWESRHYPAGPWQLILTNNPATYTTKKGKRGFYFFTRFTGTSEAFPI